MAWGHCAPPVTPVEVAPLGSMSCTKEAQWVPQLLGQLCLGSFSPQVLGLGGQIRSPLPSTKSTPAKHLFLLWGKSGTAPRGQEFVLLLAQIPLPVVQLNAPSERPGRDFSQSSLKAEELWAAFAVSSPPHSAVCAFCHAPTARDGQGGAVGAWGLRGHPNTSLT